MKPGDLVRFTVENRTRLIANTDAAAWGRRASPFKFEVGLVMGTAPGYYDGTAVEVVFPSMTGNFQHSVLEVVSENR